MATLFVDKLDPQSGTALEIGTSGDTVTVPSGATFNVAGTLGTALKNTPAFFAHMGTNQTVSNNTDTKLVIDTEILDSDGKFDTSNYRFTPTVAGYYMIGGFFRLDSATDDPYATITIYKNGAAYYKDVEGKFEVLTKQIHQVVYLDADDYVELYAYQYQGSSITVNGNSSLDTVAGTFYGYKLIGT